MKRVSFAIAVILVGQVLSAVDMPLEWNFGSRSDKTPFGYTFNITNTAAADVHVIAVVTCKCLSIVPSDFVLPAGRSRKVRIGFDPHGYGGAVANGILFRIEGGETASRLFAVKGTIAVKGSPSAEDFGCAGCRIIEEDRLKSSGR
jgi:hypothetical protein